MCVVPGPMHRDAWFPWRMRRGALPARRAMAARGHYPPAAACTTYLKPRRAVPPLHRQLPGTSPRADWRLATLGPTPQPPSSLPGASLARARMGKELEGGGLPGASCAAAWGQQGAVNLERSETEAQSERPLGIFSVKKPQGLPAMRRKAHRPVPFPAHTCADKVKRGGLGLRVRQVRS